jgi:hypothetical protein
MADLILQHCVPVCIMPHTDPPLDIDLGFTIGGAPGDGQVDVTAGGGELPATLCLPTGSTGMIKLPQVSELNVHYRKSLTGPDSITITVEATPAP